MLHELALQFKRCGHLPIVITPGTPFQNSKLVIDYIDGIEVWRFKSGYTKGVGLVRRAVTEFLLPFRAWHAIKLKVKEANFDLCINYSPTIFFGPLAYIFRSRGAYVYLVLRDMFPQWAIDQGLLNEWSLPARFFRYFETLNYRNSDCIGVMSKGNLDIFREKFPAFKNIKILRNWASTVVPAKDSRGEEFIVKLGIKDKIIFFYGGNIGHAQDMVSIMRLAQNLKVDRRAHFLIIGQGDEYNLIQDMKINWQLDNVTILPSISQSAFSGIVAAIDVGLFSLAYRHSAHNFPGKLLGYMVASKPILGCVNPGNDLLTLINTSKSGLVFIAGEDKLLAEAASKLVCDRKLRDIFGSKARKLLLQEFSVESAVASILLAMEERS
jgi:glycosyltransferase involved in cell wall biosynthesis